MHVVEPVVVLQQMVPSGAACRLRDTDPTTIKVDCDFPGLLFYRMGYYYEQHPPTKINIPENIHRSSKL
jgi:hypothetical protein